MRWIKANKYYELTGETYRSFKRKRENGTFILGIHYKIAEDGRIWINTDMIEEWIELGTQAQRIKYRDKIKAAMV